MNRILFSLLIIIILVSCNTSDQPTAVSQPTIAVQVPTLTIPTPPPESQPTEPPATPLPTAASVTSEDVVPATGEEIILIQEPRPGWRLTSPIHVSGIAGPTFEQNLVVRLLLEDGRELALVPVTIAAELGQRGPFEVDVPFTISGERQAFLQVYATSARDGGITHLSSVGFTITDSGPENRPPFTPLDEQIMIMEPTLNAVLSGGSVHVEGVGVASFEATLVVEVLDESGTVIGQAPVLVQSPDLGLPGVFTADIPYSGSPTGSGRVVVRDLSPAFGGDVHVASVEIRFE